MSSNIKLAFKSILAATAALLMAAADAKAATYSVVHNFTGNDGATPATTLVIDSSDNLYGVATSGGGNCLCGTVFEIAPDGTTTVLHTFSGPDGNEPDSSPVLDSSGNIYGSAAKGGAGVDSGGDGVIYEITAKGKQKVLYSFCTVSGCSDGANPASNLIQDKNGNLYGITQAGGANGRGTLFKLSKRKKLTVLYSFVGSLPGGNLVRDKAGDIFGLQNNGGVNGSGSVFEYSRKGVFTTLYSFGLLGTGDGYLPSGGVIMDKAGNLYGVTAFGGANGAGCIWKLAPDGTETILHSFDFGDGASPYAPLVFDQSGNLYGVTSIGGAGNHGVMFELATDGTLTVLHTFFVGTDGWDPLGGLLMAGGNTFYGTTAWGNGNGGPGDGIVFKLVN